jgi:hypothetical protein
MSSTDLRNVSWLLVTYNLLSSIIFTTPCRDISTIKMSQYWFNYVICTLIHDITTDKVSQY